MLNPLDSDTDHPEEGRMSRTTTPAGPRLRDVGFHAGELAVQERAGTRDEAERLAPMLEPAQLRGGIVAFLADRTFAVITARDADGRLWSSPLTGPAGFLRAVAPTTLAIHARLPEGDPLSGLPTGQRVGLVVVEFATRRRVRLNGALTAVGDRLAIEVEQAYGNCPQYIHQRLLAPDEPGQGDRDEVRRDTALSAADAALIRGADTFFLGTTNPERGSDASHRGGAPGFVRVDGDRLWWPDYPGNNLFNSFGNLAVDPEAALLFFDFETGQTLQLSGTAEVEWDAADRPGDDGHTGRRAVFTLQELVAGHLPPSRQIADSPYPRNPALTD
jgi:predicted pyridoxine 5'-phosphate oxidase superfamily flavin-nucleotide-binding protein